MTAGPLHLSGREGGTLMKSVLLLPLALVLLVCTAQAAGPAVSRSDFLDALWQYAGSLPHSAGGVFFDVGRDDNGSTAISWAQEMGVTQGTGNGCFSPRRPITREEAALMLRRYAEYLGRDTFLPDGLLTCNDGAEASPWAGDALYWAADRGLIDWTSEGQLDPQGTLTPEQLEHILARFFGDQ